LISYFLGELINASILSVLKLQLHGKLFAIRAIFSSLISSFLESALFGIIAFYGRIPDDELLKMTVMLTILKVLYEIVTMPLTLVLVGYLKKAENLDVYEKPSLKKILPTW
jgi:queuosine precursor transporter